MSNIFCNYPKTYEKSRPSSEKKKIMHVFNRGAAKITFYVVIYEVEKKTILRYRKVEVKKLFELRTI